MAEQDFLTEVTQKAAQQLMAATEEIHEFQRIPVGRERLTPRQFRARFGFSIRDVRAVEGKHGPEAVKEILDGLGGI